MQNTHAESYSDSILLANGENTDLMTSDNNIKTIKHTSDLLIAFKNNFDQKTQSHLQMMEEQGISLSNYKTDIKFLKKELDDVISSNKGLQNLLNNILEAVFEVSGINVIDYHEIPKYIKNFGNKHKEKMERTISDLTSQLHDARTKILGLKNNSSNIVAPENVLEVISDDKNREIRGLKRRIGQLFEENSTLKSKLDYSRTSKQKSQRKNNVDKKNNTDSSINRFDSSLDDVIPDITKRIFDDFQKKRLKKRHYVRDILEKDAHIASLEVRVGELLLKVEEAKKTLDIPESPFKEIEPELPDITQYHILESYDNLLKAKSDEILALFEQRKRLLQLVNVYEKTIEYTEKMLTQASYDNEKLNDRLDAAATEVDSVQMQVDRAIQNILDSILEFLPPEVSRKYDALRALPHSQHIIELFAMTRSELDAAKIRVNNPGFEETRLPHVTAQLENAVRFLKTMKGSQTVVPLLSDPEFRLDMNKQIENIRKTLEMFPDNHRRPSIFNTREADQHIKLFFDIAADKANESPIRELFALFSALVEINKMLTNRILEMEPQYSKTYNELAKLKQIYEDELDKQEEIRMEIMPILEYNSERQTGVDFYRLVWDLIFLESKLEASNEANSRDISVLKKNINQMEEEFGSKYNSRDKNYKNKIADLKKYKAHLQHINDDLRTTNRGLQENNEFLLADNIKLKSQNEMLLKNNKEFAYETKKLNMKIEKSRTYKANCKVLENKVMDLEDKISDLECRLSKGYDDIAALSLERNNLEKELFTVSSKKDAISKDNSDLKKQVDDLTLIIEQMLKSISKRSEILSDKIENRMKQMQIYIDESVQRYKLAEEMQAKFTNKQSEYQKVIAQLKSQNHISNVRLNDMEEHCKKVHESSEAHIQAEIIHAKQKLEIEKNEIKDFVICSCDRLIQLLQSTFKIKIQGNIDLWDIINIIEEQFNSIGAGELTRLSHEISECKARLNIGKDDSLFDAIVRLLNDYEDAKEQNKLLQDEKEVISFQKLEAEEEVNRLFVNKKMADEWEEWAKKLYMSQHDGAGTSNYRLGIENLVYSKGDPTMGRKMDILRTEKLIFTNNVIRSATGQYFDKFSPCSLRSLILVFMFVRRLRVYAKSATIFCQLNH